MRYRALIDEVQARVALRDSDEARAAVDATLASLAQLLDNPVRSALLDALPGQLQARQRRHRRRVAWTSQRFCTRWRTARTAVRSRPATASRRCSRPSPTPISVRPLADALPDDFDGLLHPLRFGGGVVGPTGGPPPLEETEIQRILRDDFPDWDGDTSALRRTISLPPENLQALAEQIRRVDPRMRSGPELKVTEDSATISLTTDTVHAVTAIDVDLARRIDNLINNISPVIGP